MKDTDWKLILALYQTRNITKTAMRMDKTQSSLTKRLKSIENELGITIVERTPRGLNFTEAGEKLVKSAEEYVAFEEKTLSNLKAM